MCVRMWHVAGCFYLFSVFICTGNSLRKSPPKLYVNPFRVLGGRCLEKWIPRIPEEPRQPKARISDKGLSNRLWFNRLDFFFPPRLTDRPTGQFGIHNSQKQCDSLCKMLWGFWIAAANAPNKSGIFNFICHLRHCDCHHPVSSLSLSRPFWLFFSISVLFCLAWRAKLVKCKQKNIKKKPTA